MVIRPVALHCQCHDCSATDHRSDQPTTSGGLTGNAQPEKVDAFTALEALTFGGVESLPAGVVLAATGNDQGVPAKALQMKSE